MERSPFDDIQIRSSVVKLRPATFDDSNDLLVWRNDPHTRAMSRDHDLVAPDDHKRWFTKALHDKGRVILLAEHEGRKIGVARFDQTETGWETGINLNPAERGKGLGGALLTMAVERFTIDHPDQILTAVIRPDNSVSRAIFEACGFRFVDRRDEHDHFVRLFLNQE